jgi:branched-chain amino acid transport system substrate-binding protein
VVLVEALKKAGPNPTRAGFVAALESLKFDAGGMDIAFSPASHQGSKTVYLTRVQGGKALTEAQMQ